MVRVGGVRVRSRISRNRGVWVRVGGVRVRVRVKDRVRVR